MPCSPSARRAHWLFLLVASLLFVPRSRAEEPPADAAFGDRLSVSLIEIPVQVLDDGRPVRGLRRESFQVSARGQRLPLVAFEVLEAEIGATEGAAPPAVPRNFLLVFDFFYGDRNGLARAVTAGRETLGRRMTPWDRVGVVIITQGGANLLSALTVDRTETLLALDVVDALLDGKTGVLKQRSLALSEHAQRAEAREESGWRRRVSGLGEAGALADRSLTSFSTPTTTGLGTAAENELVGVGRSIGSSGTIFNPVVTSIAFQDPEELTADLSAKAESSAIRAYSTMLADLATFLRDVEGTKHLIFYSMGPAGAVMVDTLALSYFESLFEAYRRSGWQIHAVDLRGAPGPGETGFAAEGLFFMADGTGGELLENFNQLDEATERILERTSVTYLLTVESPPLEANGRYLPLDVKLIGGPSGARLLHRPGFYAPKPASDRTEMERRLDDAQIILGGRELADLSGVVWAAPFRSSASGARVPVVIELPGAGLLGEGEAPVLSLELGVYALQGEAGVADLMQQRLSFDLAKTRDRLSAHGVRVVAELDLPPGEHRLRVLARHEGDGRTFLTTLTVKVPPLGQLLTGPTAILFPDLEGGWLLARESGLTLGKEHPLALGERPLIPSLAPRLGAGGALAGVLMGYQLGGAGARLDTRLLAADGKPATGGRVSFLQKVPTDGEGLDRLLLRLEAGDLAPGRYRLEIASLDAAGRRGVPVSASFEVVR